MYFPHPHILKTILISGALLSGCAPLSEAKNNDVGNSSQPPHFSSASGKMIEKQAFDNFVEAQMNELAIPGLALAVIADGEVVYHAAKGVAHSEKQKLIDETSVFEAASLSKPVFAYFVLKLADQGVIDMDRPLYQYRTLDGFEETNSYQDVTARMALSHRTGFPNWRWFDPAPPESGIERGAMYMKREPGEFGYSGEGYNYVSLVVADLVNRNQTTLDELFQEEVAKPLGLSCSSFVRTACVGERKVSGHKEGKPFEKNWPRSFPDDTPATFGAAGRLHTNALDYARIMIAMMEGEGLSSEMSSELFSKQTDVPITSTSHTKDGVTGWTLGLAMEPTDYGIRFEHGGNNGDFQSGMMFFKDQRLGFVFLTNSDQGQRLNKPLEKCITFAECD